MDGSKAGATPRVSLLGHSRGGNQAALFAQAARTRVLESLILIAPMTFDSEHLAASYADSHSESLSELIAEARGKDLTTDPDALMRVPGFLHCSDSQVSPQSFLSYYLPEYEADTPTILEQLKMPVLVITGTQDSVTPGLLERVPERDGVEMVSIDGADHFFRDLYADEGVEAIAEFMDKTGSLPR